MLDSGAYRAQELAAMRAIAQWRLILINRPPWFEKSGFPVKADSFLDLVQILDTMQEDRFEKYLAEIGGFTDDEANHFADLCTDYIDFYLKTFPGRRVIVPLSTMIAHHVIYSKLVGYKPGFARVLEIGPGCGYLSFPLRHHSVLENYTQIETTESFYLLQNLVNSHVFGGEHHELALNTETSAHHNFYTPVAGWSVTDYEPPQTIEVERGHKAVHSPWWRIGDVAMGQFDIVTSNANLTEMSREALFQYLALIREVLTDDGALIVQCFGCQARSLTSTLADLNEAGFSPVAFHPAGKRFCVINAVFIGYRHPEYEAHKHIDPSSIYLDRDLDFVNRMYFLN